MSTVTKDELADWRYQCEERIARSEMGKATPEWSLSVQDTLRLLNDVSDLQRERISLRAKVQRMRKKEKALGDFKTHSVERGTRVRNEHVRTLKRGVRNLKALCFSHMEEIIIALLGDGEMYGLEMVDHSSGLLRKGSAYVTLSRMLKKGYLEVREGPAPSGEKGPPRKYYRVAPYGRTIADAWSTLRSSLGGTPPGAGS